MKPPAEASATSHSAESRALLGLFPAFGTANPGGIQVSGELAWNALVRVCQAEGRPAHALELDRSGSVRRTAAPGSTLTHTWFDAVLRLLREPWPAQSILCWHADLIRLIPFIRGAERRILFLHGIEAWQPFGRIKQRVLAGVDLVLANSAYTLERAQQAAPLLQRVRTEIVPLGIGEPLATAPPPPDSPPAAIMIGRLEPAERYKGHEEVIRAWPNVLQEVGDARLWIVGAGSLRSELQSQVSRLGLTEQVEFFGRVEEAAKQALLSRSRCLLLPSRAEGFGLVYLEAMRYGRPCLVSVHDAGREVVNPPECGLAVDPANGADVAAAIVRLLAPGVEWATWSGNAMTRYTERYTAVAFQDRLVRALWSG